MGITYNISNNSLPINDTSILILDTECDHLLSLPKCDYIIGISSKKAISDNLHLLSECNRILFYPFPLKEFRAIIKEAVSSDISLSDNTAKHAFKQSLPIPCDDGLSIIYCGQKITLSPTEMAIMKLLLSRIGEPITRAEISNIIGGEKEIASNEADVYICYLRRKLEKVSNVKLIRSVRNVGYVIY